MRKFLGAGLLAVALAVGVFSADAAIDPEPAAAHECQFGHWTPDTAARPARDLNGDTDTSDPGEAAVAAADGECVGQQQIWDTISSNSMIWLATGIAIFVGIAGFGFVCMLVAIGVKKGLGKVRAMVSKS